MYCSSEFFSRGVLSEETILGADSDKVFDNRDTKNQICCFWRQQPGHQEKSSLSFFPEQMAIKAVYLKFFSTKRSQK